MIKTRPLYISLGFQKRDAMASELKKDKNAVNLFFLIQLLKKNVLPRKLRIKKVK